MQVDGLFAVCWSSCMDRKSCRYQFGTFIVHTVSMCRLKGQTAGSGEYKWPILFSLHKLYFVILNHIYSMETDVHFFLFLKYQALMFRIQCLNLFKRNISNLYHSLFNQKINNKNHTLSVTLQPNVIINVIINALVFQIVLFERI